MSARRSADAAIDLPEELDKHSRSLTRAADPAQPADQQHQRAEVGGRAELPPRRQPLPRQHDDVTLARRRSDARGDHGDVPAAHSPP